MTDWPVSLIAYSDYFWPWCYPAAVRLRRLADETDGAFTVEGRTFPLRPGLTDIVAACGVDVARFQTDMDSRASIPGARP